METCRILQDSTEKISVTALDSVGAFITGLSDVLLEIYRHSDGFYLDFNDAIFKNFGWIIRQGQMSELNVIYSRGVYFYDFDTTGLNDDTYFLRATSITATNLPAEGELKVGGYVNSIEDIYDMNFNKSILTKINNNNFIEEIYENDGVTVKKEFNLLKTANTETRIPV